MCSSGDREYTVIASESCFARGVDHCLVSEDDHLIIDEHGARYFQQGTVRRQFRAWDNIIDLIAGSSGYYMRASLNMLVIEVEV